MLGPHEPPPVEVVRPGSRSRVVLVCDHASHRVPEALGALGLPASALRLHIGWDIGAARVARRLSELLDAPLVLSGYSRLVIDCNRPPHVESAIPVVSGGIPVPGNEGLDQAARDERRRLFFEPYHAAIAAQLDAQADKNGGREPVLLSIHSFTPELLGQRRPWPISLLYGKDTRLAHAFLERLRRDTSLLVGDNEPYRVSATTDHTIPVHGEARGILHTALEIRQDGITEEEGACAWADRIAGLYREIEAGPLIERPGTSAPDPGSP